MGKLNRKTHGKLEIEMQQLTSGCAFNTSSLSTFQLTPLWDSLHMRTSWKLSSLSKALKLLFFNPVHFRIALSSFKGILSDQELHDTLIMHPLPFL